MEENFKLIREPKLEDICLLSEKTKESIANIIWSLICYDLDVQKNAFRDGSVCSKEVYGVVGIKRENRKLLVDAIINYIQDLVEYAKTSYNTEKPFQIKHFECTYEIKRPIPTEHVCENGRVMILVPLEEPYGRQNQFEINLRKAIKETMDPNQINVLVINDLDEIMQNEEWDGTSRFGYSVVSTIKTTLEGNRDHGNYIILLTLKPNISLFNDERGIDRILRGGNNFLVGEDRAKFSFLTRYDNNSRLI